MEQTQDSSLFGLSLDPNGKAHLAEAARWAKFIAIVGFIMCGLVVLFGIFFSSIFANLSSSARYTPYDTYSQGAGSFATMMAIIYIVIAVIWFFPFLFMFRFAGKMKLALAANDQEALNTSFQNLKIMFRYVGIITIIVLSIYVIFFLVMLAGLGMSRV